MPASELRLSPSRNAILNGLGPLRELPGTWHGTGFNLIWRPFDLAAVVNGSAGHDHFLELNRTSETLRFETIDAPIPNRGLLQDDIAFFGLHYLQQISDSFNQSALHIEPGIWINVPATTDPVEVTTVARMASIPHGTTILAQGTAFPVLAGPPVIPAVSTVPFITATNAPFPFPTESTLTNGSSFRTNPLDPAITQAMVDNPNSVLSNELALLAARAEHVVSTTTFKVSTETTAATQPTAGGGTDNVAFLLGAAPSNKPNANAAQVTATFWIEEVRSPLQHETFFQLQYTQTVILNFNGLSWPHVSVANLRKS